MSGRTVGLDRALSWFTSGWLAGIVFLNALNVVGTMMFAPSLWSGFADTQSAYNPFVFRNFVIELLAVSPAAGAILWRKLRARRKPGCSI